MFPGTESRWVQLWSDAKGKEFAVKISDEPDFRAATNPAAKYTNLVDETEYFSDVEYDWQFLLTHWVSIQDRNNRLGHDEEKRADTRPFPFDLANESVSNESISGGRNRGEKPHTKLKCRFCKLSYNTERERREHEHAWHPNKVKDSGKSKN